MGRRSARAGRSHLSSLGLPYYLGCPSWSDVAWRGSFYPADSGPSEWLALYAETFNAVEGNTTFYAWPAESVLARWAQDMPAHFRFTAKFPGDISHSSNLLGQLEAAGNFLRLLAPLGTRVSPVWLQLPAGFGPQRLAELAGFIDAQSRPLAVEVRHPAFFAKGDDERALNRLLRDSGTERICLDPRALFSVNSSDPAIRHAQDKKPRVPPRPAAFTRHPQVRFIGLPEVEQNETFLTPWVEKVAAWIEEGLSPYVFLHTADNRQAPALARHFHARLTARLPGLPALTEPPQPAQLGLL
ncbi:DUF72 domain-containing protein [Pseudomonas sp. RIT-PI-S]|uniref:DUF72 domain-containing protein n=1 Tax=Pseudomonas sp. RIT-PI-S TaxID=3035295 RepID=UPI0021D8B184|nr:DUF72 domain-containing protein [Pseudomonas sp. RIT-PI-S]